MAAAQRAPPTQRQRDAVHPGYTPQKDGKRCNNYVNKARCKVCRFHASKMLKRTDPAPSRNAPKQGPGAPKTKAKAAAGSSVRIAATSGIGGGGWSNDPIENGILMIKIARTFGLEFQPDGTFKVATSSTSQEVRRLYPSLARPGHAASVVAITTRLGNKSRSRLLRPKELLYLSTALSRPPHLTH